MDCSRPGLPVPHQLPKFAQGHVRCIGDTIQPYVYIYYVYTFDIYIILFYGVLQARTLEWVAILFSRESSWPRDQTRVSYIAGRFFTVWATGKAPPALM